MMKSSLPDARQSGAAGAVCLLAGAAVLSAAQPWPTTVLALALSAPLYALAGRGFFRGQPQYPAWRYALAAYLLLLNAWLLSRLLPLLLYWWPAAPQPWLLAMLWTLVCAYGAWLGRVALLRLTVLVVALLLLMAIVDTLLLLPQIQLSRLAMASLWQQQAAGQTAEQLLLLIAPLPALCCYGPPPQQPPQQRRQLSRGLWRGFALAAAYLLLLRLRDTAVLGALAELSPWPLLRTLSQASAGMGLNRVEFLGLLAFCAALCCANMLLLGGAVRLLRPERDEQPSLAVAVVAAVISLGLTLLFYSLSG